MSEFVFLVYLLYPFAFFLNQRGTWYPYEKKYQEAEIKWNHELQLYLPIVGKMGRFVHSEIFEGSNALAVMNSENIFVHLFVCLLVLLSTKSHF